MCCFGIRVFLLFLITFLSLALHKIEPKFTAIFYYLVLANILSFTMLCLYFKNALPKFAKESSMHYFSIIGGIIGSFLSMLIFKKIKLDKFYFIELIIAIFWVFLSIIFAYNLEKILLLIREFTK